MYEIPWKWADRRYRMFRIDEYINEFIITLKDVFRERLLYIGIQGSYLRNEETQNSGIDIMAVIGNLPAGDLKGQGKLNG